MSGDDTSPSDEMLAAWSRLLALIERERGTRNLPGILDGDAIDWPAFAAWLETASNPKGDAADRDDRQMHAPSSRPALATPRTRTGERFLRELAASPPPAEYEGRLDRAAQVGVPFRAVLRLDTPLEDAEAEGLENTGIAFDADDLVFHGVPEKAGKFDIGLTGWIAGEPARINLTLQISPDPWSMWTDRPTPNGIAFYKPDTDCDRQDSADMTLLAASRRGRSHAHKGAPRDDHAGIFADLASGWHIGVVADGAGSAEFSRAGSAEAVDSVLALLPARLEEDLSPLLDRVADGEAMADMAELFRIALWKSLAGSAHIAAGDIADLARRSGHDIADFNTTLLIGAVRRVEGHGWYCATFSIGDGMAGVIAESSAHGPRMMTADSGDFAGQTRFLSEELFADRTAIASRLHHRIEPELTALALMTDGVSDPMFRTTDEPDDPAAWARFWETAGRESDLTPDNDNAHRELLDWLNFRVRGEHDDRSLVLMLPRPG